jgi:hypothetical protein
MLTEDPTKAAADSLQAQPLRQCLDEERAKVASRLGKHAEILNGCATSVEVGAVSHHRGRIRQLETRSARLAKCWTPWPGGFQGFDEHRRA